MFSKTETATITTIFSSWESQAKNIQEYAQNIIFDVK